MYETKGKIRRDRDAFKSEAVRLRSQLERATGRVGTLTRDQQALVDVAWRQRVLGRSASHLRMVLVAMMLLVVGAFADLSLWSNSGWSWAFAASLAATGFCIWIFIAAVLRGRDGFGVKTTTVVLPSGEVAEVTPAQVEHTQELLARMAES